MDRPIPWTNRSLTVAVGVLLSWIWIVPADAGVTVERNIEFARRGAEPLHADVYKPEGAGPFPGVLMVHGGGWMWGRRSDMSMHARWLAERGYTVVSISYRLAPQHKFPAQLDDCRDALLWIRQNADRFQIDSSRIAGFGYSAGGHLVCLLGLLGSDNQNARLQAVVAGGAPCEFRTVPKSSDVLRYWLGGNRATFPDAYRDASPTAFVTRDDPPVFFYHGERDRIVPYRNAEGLHRMLKESGVRTHMHVVSEAGHIKTFFDQKPVDRAIDFLDDILKPLPQE